MKKEALLTYAASIGLDILSDTMLKEEILNAVLDYQEELLAEQGEA